MTVETVEDLMFSESVGVLTKKRNGQKSRVLGRIFLSEQFERTNVFESVVSKTKLSNLNAVNLTEWVSGTAFVTGTK